MTARDIGIKCLKDEAEALLELIPKMDEEFDRAVELMFRCHGKIIVTGVGKSGHVGAKIAATLSSTGTPSFFINPLDVFHGDLGVMTSDDVVLAISNSGQTDELLRFIPLVLQMQIPIVAMSGNPESLLAKYADCHLNVNVRHEADPMDLAPTSSSIAQMAMGDALATAVQSVAAVPDNSRIVIFMSDGVSNTGRITIEEALKIAKETDVKIYTIGIGSDPQLVQDAFGFVQLNISSSLDEETLHQIATETGGKYFRARSTSDLKKIYELIDELETTPVETDSVRPRKEMAFYLILVALGLWALGFIMERHT